MAKNREQIEDVNILHKVFLKGVQLLATATEINQLSGLVITAAELGKLAGVTAGQVTASKAVVVGANKNVDVLAIADLKLGAGAGVSVTKTAAEINLLLGGLAAGKKIAFGTAAVGAASEDVVTGLATVEYASCSLAGDPSATHAMSTCTVGNQTNAPTAGKLRIKSWKFTGTADTALIAADTVFANVNWVAIGT